jgi:hypothetical protein
MDARLTLFVAGTLICAVSAACSSDSNGPSGSGGTGGDSSSGGGSGGAGQSGGPGSGATSGTGATSGASGSGGTSSTSGGTPGTSGSGGAAPATGGASSGHVVTNCADAQAAYTVTATALDASYVPYVASRGSGINLYAQAPVAVADDGAVYIGFTRDQGGTRSAMIVGEPGSTFQPITVAGAVLGGVAATSDGVAALLFDPAEINQRKWAQVKRFGRDGTEKFSTDLFRSPNLDDEGTRGEPGTSRLAYIAATDQLIAYFGHTRRYDDGVRHQGGYVAAVDASGAQTVLGDWFGSHNLDQRLLVEGNRAALLGLGDAFPKGIFFSFTGVARMRPSVVYLVAGDGSGTANGQLGGMVDVGSSVAVPFITNRSITQELDPGPWPNPDPAIQAEIRAAATSGRELGLVQLSKQGAIPAATAITPVWVETTRGSELGDQARLEALKSARYGTGELILLGWTEATGTRRDRTAAVYTLVVDGTGKPCQPKARLADDKAFAPGDDIVRRPDGSIVWTNASGGAIRVIKLVP